MAFHIERINGVGVKGAGLAGRVAFLSATVCRATRFEYHHRNHQLAGDEKPFDYRDWPNCALGSASLARGVI